MSRIPPEATDPATAAYKYTVTFVHRKSEYQGVGAVPEDVDAERVSFVTAILTRTQSVTARWGN